MKQFLSKTLFTAFVATAPIMAALGDKVNLDQSSTNVDPGVTASTAGWALLARECCETGAHQGDVISTKTTDVLTVNIPAQSGVARYALKLHGKFAPHVSTYTISVDGDAATNHSTTADESKPHQQLFATRVVSGSAHQVNIVNTGGENFAVDFFLIEEIPAPVLNYTASVTEAVAQNFSGAVGNVSITNTVVLLGDDATLSLEGEAKDHFALSSGELSFTAPENPAASYTVTIKADHMGESTTQDVTVNVVDGNGGGNVSLESVQGVLSSSQLVNVYDLQGNLIRSRVKASAWNTELTQGMYVVRWENTTGIVTQKMAIVP